ncbi:MAG TPA: 3-oxo-tetronate kinase [Roseiarcus sp.]|jgi:uncharacterized protein YgbK (DUF1537 family)
MLLGCIADDLTGATDLSLMLSREGMRTVQTTGIPPGEIDLDGVDALVIALKSRSIPARQAVSMSLEAARRLRDLGARRFLFKYCSTFDSTDEGNIGPVLEALLEFVGGGQTIACPAFPATGRTIYAGHLFVNGVLLSESPMKDHPLNPMHDSDLSRVLQRQTRRAVGLIGFEDVDGGVEAIGKALKREAAASKAVSIVDALSDRHLRDIGAAVADHALVTGGSGIAIGLPSAYVAKGLLAKLTPPDSAMPAPAGRRAIIAGSCSQATRGQIEVALQRGMAAFHVDVDQLVGGSQTVDSILEWTARQDIGQPFLVYSSADPEVVRAAQQRLGREAAGALVEETLSAVAKGCMDAGVTQFLVAGGETSGAVVQALDAKILSIGPEIDPGVPWTRTLGQPDLALALKSGNFGAPDFFYKAWNFLQ